MPVSEKSLANLNPAKPGEVRNPVGVNRKRPWTDRYYKNPLPNLIRVKFNEKMGAEVLEATLADVGTLRTHMDAIMEGGTRAAREMRCLSHNRVGAVSRFPSLGGHCVL